MISIIVPIYNSEKWVGRCIESLINQTYKNIEIILINDGSTDKSAQICKEYAEKDERIVFIDKENEGVSSTRNLGIKKAKGEFLQFVDSDDYIDPQMCEKLVKAITDADMVICGIRVWEKGVILREPHLKQGEYILNENVGVYFELRKINLGPCNKLYRKQKIVKGFRAGLSLGEDTLFVLDYMRNVKRIAVLSDCLYNVVLDNQNSLNHQPKQGKIDLLIEQRITEEAFLTDVYGKDCDLTEMYGHYLSTAHVHFLEAVKYSNENLKNEIERLLNNRLLGEKIRKSRPKRLDMKVFKILFDSKNKFLISLYFKTKNKWYGRKKTQ